MLDDVDDAMTTGPTNGPGPRWSLLGPSTNEHGVSHFSLTRRGENADDADLAELLDVLRSQFGAVDDGELTGPYSIHRYFKVDGLRFGIVLDQPEWLDLYAAEEAQNDTMAAFVTMLLKALNGARD